LFDDIPRRLIDELDIDPGIEPRQAPERALRPDAPDLRHRPAQLPADVSGFTGRHQHFQTPPISGERSVSGQWTTKARMGGAVTPLRP
jgi:hypothetical protein